MAARTTKEGRPSPGRGGFLKPTVSKLVFLAEWTIFILISVLREELEEVWGTVGKRVALARRDLRALFSLRNRDA
jgi:hypothetical protein